MTRMTGGQAIVRSLKTYGVDTVFGVPGLQLDHLFNAYHGEQEGFRVIHTRHEQGAAYMALGYAQSTGKVGVYSVVPGPGVLNTTAALSTAYATGTKVFCITGQIPSGAIGRGIGLLHEIPDQLGILQRLTKWAVRADDPALVPGLIRDGMRQLHTGRTRPVAMEMAMDLLAKETEVAPLPAETDFAAPPPDPDAIERAAKLLGGAKNPIIFVGGGIWGAEAELIELAETLQAAVVTTRGAMGAISAKHPLAVSVNVAHKMWPKADVVLGIGTRLEPTVPGWGVDKDLKIIRIDIDPVEISRNHRPEVGILGDSKDALTMLLAALPKHNGTRASRADEYKAAQAAFLDEIGSALQPQYSYLMAIRDALGDDGIFIDELTQPGYLSRLCFPVYKPRTYVTTGYQGTLGYGYPTGLGAKVGNPSTPVVSISGDGGFMFNVQEVATAVHHKIPLVTVIFNDGAYGNVQRMQIENYGNKVIASDLTNPDFPKLAESFGAMGLRARNADELRARIEEALKAGAPTLIDVPMGRVPSPWPFVQLPKAR